MADQNRVMNFHSSILQVASLIKNNEQNKSKDCEMEKKRRERKANYSREETNRLVALIIPRKYILENKGNSTNERQEKNQLWEDIATKFNYKSKSSDYRDGKTLRMKFESMKKDIKRKWSIIVGKRRSTNGHLPRLSGAEKKMMKFMELPIKERVCSVNENSDNYDGNTSDSSRLNTRESEWSPVKQEIKPTDEEDGENLESKDDTSECMSLSDDEPPNKRTHNDHYVKNYNSENEKSDRIYLESLSETLTKETQKDPLIPTQSVENVCGDTVGTNSNEEKLRLQTELLKYEIEIKKLQKKLLEEDLLHKKTMHELEKQHFILKIELLKKGI